MSKIKRQITPSELNWGEVYFIKKWDPQSDTMELVLSSGVQDNEVVTKETVVVYPVDPDYASSLVLFVVGKSVVRKLAGILRILEDYFFPSSEDEDVEEDAFHKNEEPLL